jgi:CRISPR-associated protein Csb2
MNAAKCGSEKLHLIDALDRRIEALLRKAILQAGFSRALAENAELEWRTVGFWAGTERSDRYDVPKHLRAYPRFHVRVGWRDENWQPVSVRGPICIGGGRFGGLGLFAAL